MMASSEDLRADTSARLTLPLLSMLLGFVAVFGLVVHGYLSMNRLWGPQGRSVALAILFNLLLVGGIWALSKGRPSRSKAIAQLVLLALAAFMVLGATATILKNLHASDLLGLWYWNAPRKTLALIGANLLVFTGAIWGVWAIKPWQALKRSDEPVSPATRRTRQLFGVSGVVGILAIVVLMFGIRGNGANPVWSNSQNVSIGVAIAAIAIWLASMVLSWWWYYSADEHERRANDVGFLFGGGLFLAVTPAWWILARAGLLPPPDAMVLWYATVVAIGVGWAWYRNR